MAAKPSPQEFISPSADHIAGQVNYMHDATDNRFDRSYDYDHKGRLTQALSGSEANGGSSSSWTGPYKRDYDYDVWDNMAPSGRFWSATQPYYGGVSYTNDRLSWTIYDDAGNRRNGDPVLVYDAAGQQISVDSQTTGTGEDTITHVYDGDGHDTYRDDEYVDWYDTDLNNSAKTHLLNSTVLCAASDGIGI